MIIPSWADSRQKERKTMTPTQEKDLQDLFMKYGNPSTESDVRMSIHVIHPDALNELDKVLYYDNKAVDTIKEFECKIEQLKAYRIALSERYNYLATAPTQPVVRLKRERRYYENKVYYFLVTYSRNMLDGSEVQTSSTKYTGQERHKAISDYKAYIKSHPGIIAEMNIAKPKWEH